MEKQKGLLDLARALEKKDIKVDLLITLDAADGNKSDKINRNVPSNVVRNINYYQTNAKNTTSWLKNRIGSKGGANSRAAGNDKTQILNIDDTKNRYDGKEDNAGGQVNHYNIDNSRKDDIVSDIKECEGEPPISTKKINNLKFMKAVISKVIFIIFLLITPIFFFYNVFYDQIRIKKLSIVSLFEELSLNLQ